MCSLYLHISAHTDTPRDIRKYLLSRVIPLHQGSTGSGFYSLGRKCEGKNQLFWCGKEMGRKKVIVSVWEGNGKEIMRLVGMGGKWEGNYNISWHCKEMGRLVGEGNGKEK